MKGVSGMACDHVVHRAGYSALFPSGQQHYHLDGAHDFGALIQDLVEERDRASTRFDPGPFVLHGHSRAQGVGRNEPERGT